ncbi:hypothetical protein ILUMI_23813 [Ignelater luminosus]|uniref:MULE transposase domain-containing protein n=1 Tax=Ignelater luminosus TaxID=2038154 RepID=A0A8K0CBQ4_IGNLU|nr:hypothetical protein ILUMI_23813 [Ignelater luminosus]
MKKNKLKLFEEAFIYDKERVREDRTYGKCEECFTESRQGQAVTKTGAVVPENGKHNHLLRGERVGAAKPSTTNDNPQQIIGKAIGAIPNLLKRLRHQFQQFWKRTNPAPRAPTSFSELVFNGIYSKTSSEEDFLFFYSGAGDPNRILSSMKRNLEVLSSSDHWFCDSTFKTAPLLFTQLMTIYAIKFDAVIPLPNKTNTTYKRVLEQLKNLKSDLKPTTVMTDFESALYGAFAEILDGIQLRDCFFHCGQCFWLQIQRSNLLAKYIGISDPDFGICSSSR